MQSFSELLRTRLTWLTVLALAWVGVGMVVYPKIKSQFDTLHAHPIPASPPAETWWPPKVPEGAWVHTAGVQGTVPPGRFQVTGSYLNDDPNGQALLVAWRVENSGDTPVAVNSNDVRLIIHATHRQNCHVHVERADTVVVTPHTTADVQTVFDVTPGCLDVKSWFLAPTPPKKSILPWNVANALLPNIRLAPRATTPETWHALVPP